MDPNETLRLFIDALKSSEACDAREHLNDLTGWIESGAFPPDVEGSDLLYVLGKALNHQEIIESIR